MLANELRQLYIDYFKEKGHLHLPGAPLIPIDTLGGLDTSTLFTSAGMQQFKPYFTGEASPPGGRVVTIQKCMRTGDIDSVGDFSHCTFFEMLGNFSFGDYFKAEVIPWTWEFLIDRLRIDPDRICVTVYAEDDEAYEIWNKTIGLPEDRIHRMGEDKNYWPANAISEGPNGPCGPCSEIFYRVAPLETMTDDTSLTPTERYKIDDDAGRWLEIWNNVFTQYNRSEDEHGRPVLTPLPKKNNDTGAGFDRIARVIQGKNSVFETDLFEPILRRIEELSGKKYSGTSGPIDFAFRVIAEHSRCMCFCIADGITPGNTGREYVLRRIMRRAIRFGKSVLGFEEPFLHLIAPTVAEQMGDFYPELREKGPLIQSTVQTEEVRFRQTLDNGSLRLQELMNRPDVVKSKALPGDEVYDLHQTYGFPLELTEEIASERGLSVDREGYVAAKKKHEAVSGSGSSADVFRSSGGTLGELQQTIKPTEFVGYHTTGAPATIAAIIHDGRLVETGRAGDEVEIVLDRTPFYAESGGQIGDSGRIGGKPGSVQCRSDAAIADTKKVGGIFIHLGRILEGEIETGQEVLASVDLERRWRIMKNHTATHLLHAALRKTLGNHVHQKGSLVAPDRLRFDFTHTSPMSHDEVEAVEAIVNDHILRDEAVHVHVDVPVAEAKARGAMALFGEKYGDRVRMVEIPNVSMELCGGTHLQHTSQAGLFKITSETGVSSGVRRIEAVTGAGVLELMKDQESRLEQAARALKSNPRDLLVAIEKLQIQRASLEKQVQQLKTGSAGNRMELQEQTVDGIKILTGSMPDADGETLSAMADRAAAMNGSAVVLIAGAVDGKALFAAKVTPDLVKRGYHAGNLVREVAKIAGGGGGGRADFAQAGGRDASKVAEALGAVPELIMRQGSG